MTTVKELIDMLKIYKQDGYITNELNQDFIHIRSTDNGNTILSTVKPIAIHAETGQKVYPPSNTMYYAFSPELNGNVYAHECISEERKPIENDD